MEERSAQACRIKALDLLARREHSSVELQRKLLSREFDAEIVVDVVLTLVREALLSDERFVESYVRARSKRGVGPLKLRQELEQRGVDRALVEAQLEHYAWHQLAAAARLKRYGAEIPQAFKLRAKQMRFLQSRGFSTEHINDALSMSEWESLGRHF